MAKSSHTIRVHAAPAKVYQALITKDGLKGWFTTHHSVGCMTIALRHHGIA